MVPLRSSSTWATWHGVSTEFFNTTLFLANHQTNVDLSHRCHSTGVDYDSRCWPVLLWSAQTKECALHDLPLGSWTGRRLIPMVFLVSKYFELTMDHAIAYLYSSNLL